MGRGFPACELNPGWKPVPNFVEKCYMPQAFNNKLLPALQDTLKLAYRAIQNSPVIYR